MGDVVDVLMEVVLVKGVPAVEEPRPGDLSAGLLLECSDHKMLLVLLAEEDLVGEVCIVISSARCLG